MKNYNLLYYSIAPGMLLGISWLLPNSYYGAILALVSVFIIYLALSNNQLSYLYAFIFSFIYNLIAFYWLFFTINVFSGFNSFLLSILVFLLFLLYSSLYFILITYVYKSFSSVILKPLAFSLSWFSLEGVFPFIFPWKISQTQIVFLPFASLAEFVGGEGLTLMMLFSIGLFCFFWQRKELWRCVLVIFILTIVLLLGDQRNKRFTHLFLQGRGDSLSLAIIQENISLKDKHNPSKYYFNFKSHLNTLEKIKGSVDIALMPESALMFFLQQGKEYKHIVSPGIVKKAKYMLFGSLTQDNNNNIFNSAVLLETATGNMSFYNKEKLVPFGEYTPFSEEISVLEEINKDVINFAKGKGEQILTAKVNNVEVNIGVLICYEDIFSDLAAQKTNNGANILVNLTNDAWFGKRQAPYQHLQASMLRALENRRYFVRATNTGVSAIISPAGEIVKALPVDTKGIILSKIYITSNKGTIYSQYIQWFLKFLSMLILCLAICQKVLNLKR